MHRYLSADLICNEMRTLFRKRISRKTELWGTDNVQGKKYEHIFAQNWGYCAYYPFNGRDIVFTNSFLFAEWDVFF